MKSAILAIALGAAAVSAVGNYSDVASTTSTVYTTSVYTITSCASTVTDCPAKMGQVTTDIISLYTTVCPVTATEKTTSPPAPTYTPYTTSTIYITKEYTITACPAYVTNCPVGSKTTTILTTTTVCPVTTSTAMAPPTTKVAPPASYTAVAPPASSSVGPPVSLSVITYSTCVPTTYISVITVTAGAPSATVVPVCPGGVNCPAVSTTVVPVCPGGASCPTTGKSYGTAVPTAPKNSTQTYVPVTGAAAGKSAAGFLAAVGVAAAALLL